MKKLKVILCAACAAFAALAALPALAEYDVIVNTEAGVNLRSGPGPEYDTVLSEPISLGEYLTITDTAKHNGNLWGKTQYIGDEGWVYLANTTEYKDADYDIFITGASGANVRDGPGPEFEVLDTCEPGEELHIYGEAEHDGNLWGEIRFAKNPKTLSGYSSYPGWIYLANTSKVKDVDYSVYVNARDGDGLNIRSGPSTSFDRLMDHTIPMYTKLHIKKEVLNANGRKWGYTSYWDGSSVDGWVSLAETSSSDPRLLGSGLGLDLPNVTNTLSNAEKLKIQDLLAKVLDVDSMNGSLAARIGNIDLTDDVFLTDSEKTVYGNMSDETLINAAAKYIASFYDYYDDTDYDDTDYDDTDYDDTDDWFEYYTKAFDYFEPNDPLVRTYVMTKDIEDFIFRITNRHVSLAEHKCSNSGCVTRCFSNPVTFQGIDNRYVESQRQKQGVIIAISETAPAWGMGAIIGGVYDLGKDTFLVFCDEGDSLINYDFDKLMTEDDFEVNGGSFYPTYAVVRRRADRNDYYLLEYGREAPSMSELSAYIYVPEPAPKKDDPAAAETQASDEAENAEKAEETEEAKKADKSKKSAKRGLTAPIAAGAAAAAVVSAGGGAAFVLLRRKK